MSDVELFGKALGLDEPWEVVGVAFDADRTQPHYIAMIYLVVGKLDPGPAI
jgi:hypothetical protein